jgi:hypothetical protein
LPRLVNWLATFGSQGGFSVRWLQGKPGRTHASLDARAPLRRSDDLIVDALDDELLIFDRTIMRAHCLSADAARVWQGCDGSRDATALSAELGLPRDVVRRALEELEASQLLDQGLELVDVNPGNGKAVTRRQLAVRSAKLGTAVATAPLILSITAPSAMAAASPTFDACAISTGNSCGNNPGECGFILGCCCCCNWVSGGQCQLCTPFGLCSTNGGNCPNPYLLGGGLRANCNSGNVGTAPPNPAGCCGAGGAGNCGCSLSSTGFAGNAPNSGSVSANAGTANNGPGCCIPGATPAASQPCTAGSTGCVPCCNGSPLPLSGTSARPGCCGTNAATGSTMCGIP